MIEYITGELTRLTPTEAVVETRSGVAYLINISLTTFTPLQNQKSAKLLIHEIIREDTHDLYGFLESNERELFRLLISVSGVGANTARMILSSIPPKELEVVITQGDSRRLKAVKGIGAKTAERIIVDLRDKIKIDDSSVLIATEATPSSEVFEEALAALIMLGFPKPASNKVLTKIFAAKPDIKVELAIKQALSML